MRYRGVKNALLRIFNCATARFQLRYCPFLTTLLRIFSNAIAHFHAPKASARSSRLSTVTTAAMA